MFIIECILNELQYCAHCIDSSRVICAKRDKCIDKFIFTVRIINTVKQYYNTCKKNMMSTMKLIVSLQNNTICSCYLIKTHVCRGATRDIIRYLSKQLICRYIWSKRLALENRILFSFDFLYKTHKFEHNDMNVCAFQMNVFYSLSWKLRHYNYISMFIQSNLDQNVVGVLNNSVVAPTTIYRQVQ